MKDPLLKLDKKKINELNKASLRRWGRSLYSEATVRAEENHYTGKGNAIQRRNAAMVLVLRDLGETLE